MSDEPSLHVDDAIRVTLPEGVQPDEIALASSHDGTLWCAIRGSRASGESMLTVQRVADVSEHPVRSIGTATGLGGIAVSNDTVWAAYRDGSGRAALASLNIRDGSVRIDPLDARDEAPRIARGSPRGDAIIWPGDFAATLPLGVRAIAVAVPSTARDATLAAGADAAGVAFVNERFVELADEAGTTRFEALSSRARAHAPAVTRVNGRWAAAWVSEDTGKLVMARSIAGEPSARVAEVWCALTRPWASAPGLVGDAKGAWIAWREERGPRAGVYLRRLDTDLRQIAREVRISDRASIAASGRVSMAAAGESAVAIAWIEARDGVRSAWVRTVRL